MFSFDHFDVDIIFVVSITVSTDMHHYFADGDTLITFIWVMVVSRPPMILTFQFRIYFLDTDVPTCGNAGHMLVD